MGPELALWEAVVRLLLAAALAGAIGLERELQEQEAGLRTHILVGVGACLFVIGGNYGWAELNFGNQVGIVLDPARITAYVITGVGFLGGGAILKYGVNVRGLTTAASLWVVAAIGTTSAVGLYALAVITTGIALFSLWPLRRAVTRLGLRARGTQRLTVELEDEGRVAAVVQAVEDGGADIASAKLSEGDEGRVVELVVSGTGAEYAELLDGVSSVVGVRSAAWAD